MGIRNCAELGENLQLIVKRLMANKDLVKLLYYTDKDPLSNEDLTPEQLQNEVFNQLIKIVPYVGSKETAKSLVVLRVIRGTMNTQNEQFRDIRIGIEVFVPMTQWIIKDTNLRPFKILGEIQKSLNGKTINGLGKLVGGDFDLNFLTEEISDYETIYSLIEYN